MKFKRWNEAKPFLFPDILMVDPGKEFMGSVATLMKNHNVKIQRSEAGNHRAQLIVERVMNIHRK